MNKQKRKLIFRTSYIIILALVFLVYATPIKSTLASGPDEAESGGQTSFMFYEETSEEGTGTVDDGNTGVDVKDLIRIPRSFPEEGEPLPDTKDEDQEKADDSLPGAIEESLEESTQESAEEEQETPMMGPMGGPEGVPPGGPMRNPPSYTDVIDLSTTVTDGPGYTVSAGLAPFIDDYPFMSTAAGMLTFTQDANGNAYKIIQTRSIRMTSTDSPITPKDGSSIFRYIYIQSGIEVTLVLNEITLQGRIEIAGTGKLNLLLEGDNFIRRYKTGSTNTDGFIRAPDPASITINSIDGSEEGGSLTITSTQNGTSGSSRNAGIGGGPGVAQYDGGQKGGYITINGGTIDITVRSIGAGIGGGGGLPNGVLTTANGGDGGNITINGGKISVTQYSYGNDLGSGEAGAGIGGGGGAYPQGSGIADGGDGGNITINGGTVKVVQYSNAAGIGGGRYGTPGNIVIEGGDIDVWVGERAAGVGNGGGAGIGSGAGAQVSGDNHITINGGTVKSVAFFGAGIGVTNGGIAAHTSITGGNIYAMSQTGAGIGVVLGYNGDTISITGGNVIAESLKNAGIGGSLNAKPAFHLGGGADVRAYSGGNATIASNVPAINTQQITGDGYFVNAYLTTTPPVAPTTLLVYKDDNLSALLRTLTLPGGYRNFAYSSDPGVSRTDNIFSHNGTQLGSAVVRDTDSNSQIYSINTLTGYDSHNFSANRGRAMLPVKMGAAGSYFSVTEKYVDIYGAPVGKTDTIALISSGNTYAKPIPQIEGYKPRGYKWGAVPPDNSGSDFQQGSPNKPISANDTIYFVYKFDTGVADVTISKIVSGDYASKMKSFEFTVSFMDENGQALSMGETFDSEGGTIPGKGASKPNDKVLTLEAGGKAVFQLKHGQTITIKDVPSDVMIKIKETDNSYSTTYKVNENGAIEDGKETIPISVDEGLAIEFQNAIETVPPTGVDASKRTLGLLLIVLSVGFLTRLARKKIQSLLLQKS